MDAGAKVCPRCAETVKSEALACRFCGHTFGAPPHLAPAEQRKSRLLTGCFLVLMLILALAWMGKAFSHPGGLAADGCHREKATGTRHCHPERAAGRERPSTGSGRAGLGLMGSGAAVSAFPNCAAARAAGAAPVRRGDPGYSARLDRDGDGVACE